MVLQAGKFEISFRIFNSNRVIRYVVPEEFAKSIIGVSLNGFWLKPY